MTKKPALKDVAALLPEASNLQEIATGGYKVVYQGQIAGKTEAIKCVHIPSQNGNGNGNGHAEDAGSIRAENLRRIYREIEILGKCRTPYLVKLGSLAPRECDINQERYVIYSEEYISGESLRIKIKANHRPALAELTGLAGCLLHAVQELAGENIIHRDIKPDNIIGTGQAARPYVLLDLGIAFQVGGTQITRNTAHIPGTLYYIAPEMLDAGFRQNLDYRADLYTIGLTLYEYGTGDNPFAHPKDPQYTTLYRIKTETPKPMAGLRPDLPPAFCELVEQLMKKLPALRPANIPSLLKRMEELR